MLPTSTSQGGSCNIVITGGAGFLGVRLARTLLAQVLWFCRVAG